MAGSLIEPPTLPIQNTQVEAIDPVTFTFPEVQDSGSIINGDESGLESCGPRTYELYNGGSFLSQQDDSRELVL